MRFGKMLTHHICTVLQSCYFSFLIALDFIFASLPVEFNLGSKRYPTTIHHLDPNLTSRKIIYSPIQGLSYTLIIIDLFCALFSLSSFGVSSWWCRNRRCYGSFWSLHPRWPPKEAAQDTWTGAMAEELTLWLKWEILNALYLECCRLMRLKFDDYMLSQIN